MTSTMTTGEAYAKGLTSREPRLHIYEMARAARDWHKAETEHAHTSYYGVAHIRAMRAYWLGRIRAWRRDNGAPFPACMTFDSYADLSNFQADQAMLREVRREGSCF